LGGRIGKLFVSLSTSSVANAEITLPEEFVQTVWEGTEQYLNQTLDIGPSVNFIAYQKVGLGLNYEVNPRLSVGVRVNRLLGAGSFVTDRSSLTLRQSSDIYQTTAEMDYKAYYYGAGQFNLLDQSITGFENLGDAFDEDGVEPEGGSGIREFTNGNGGWAVDLGAEYLLGDRLTLSASVLNLGSIRWENATQELGLIGTVSFEGVDAANLEDDEDFEIVPGIDTVGQFEAVSNVGYTQSLAPRTYLGANYQVLPFLDVGGLLYNEFFADGTFTALSLSSRISLGRSLSVGGIYTLQNGTFNSFGGNVALKLGPLQIYAIADNLSSVTNEERLDGANFRTGLNLTFGRKKSDQRLATARGVDLDMPDPVNLPSAQGIAAEETNVEPAKVNPEEPSVTEEETPSIEALPEPMEETSEVVLEEAAPEAEVEETSEEQPALISSAPLPEEEAAELPENHPANADGLKLFPFKLEIRDNEDLGLISEAKVDVFRIEQGGYYKLIQTAEAFGGRVNLTLSAEKLPYQAVVLSANYDSLIVDFFPERKASFQQVVFLNPSAVADTVDQEEQASETFETDEFPEKETAPVSEIQEPVAFEEEMINSASSEPEMAVEDSEPVAVPDSEPAQIQEEESPPEQAPEAQIVPPADMSETEEVAPVPAEQSEEESIYPIVFNPPYATYLVTQRTSLRKAPEGGAEVISRLPVCTELKLLEQTNEWWWKVSMGGWEGYVKAALLKLRD
ncbi:MAG: hypothetical protein KI786_00425, partial [Mameliella sp.]|nr:hypothetical protein [Phaeodactylibacter sp.]